MAADFEEVLEFWFGTQQEDSAVCDEKSTLWWAKNENIDEAIAGRFGSLVRSAADRGLNAWTSSPRGRLALIILLDQFTRNIHRDTPQAFAHDSYARRLCLEGVEMGDDQKLRLVERVFFYLPMEHSESLELQEKCVDRFEELLRSAPPSARQKFRSFLEFALRHRDIIAKFGRFPHRNVVLDRTSTREEVEFLRRPGSSF